MTKMSDRTDGIDSGEERVANVHDIRYERRLKKKKKRIKRILGVTLLLTVCIVGYATRNFWVTPLGEFFQESKDTIVNDGTPENSNGYPITLGQSENYNVTEIDGMLAVVSDTHITTYSDKGGKVKSVQHLFANPVYYKMGERLFVYDLDGYNFSLYDKKGEIYNKKTEDTIVLAAAGNKNCVAVVTQTDKYNSYLTVYDESGEAIFKWASSQRIVSVAFNNDETGCIVSTFSASAGKIVSKVYCLEFDKTEEIFETEDLGCMLYKIGYCKNGDMWLLGDTVLYRVGSDGSVIYSYSYDNELAGYDLDDKCAVLVFTEFGNKGSEILIFGEDKEPGSFSTENKVKKLEAVDGEAVYLTDDSFAVLNKSGKIVASADIEKSYSDFTLIDDAAYFLGYNEVDKVSFKK